MTPMEIENTRLIARYLDALSGHPKTPDLVARFVTDVALAEHIAQVEAAFASYELVADQVVADGDTVAMRGTFRGRQTGQFAGMAPTGRDVSATLMIFYRIENGRIAEHWLQFDAGALVAQLQQAVATSASA